MKNSQESKIESIRHSLAHLLAMAVLKKFPKAKLGIGPVIENGFYYDFKLPKPITDADLPDLEKYMRELVSQKLDFTGEKVTPLKAKKIFKDQPFKLDLIKEYSKEGRELTIYHTGDFTDLCKGGHIKNTSEINPQAFKLEKITGAYWRGSEKNPQLTRIYGLAFETGEELETYLKQQEEAIKRDHKKLGLELDLFTFSDLVGPGLPLWTPRGTLIRHLLDNRVWALRKTRGYMRVEIPHITKKDLYERSGHWDKFKDEIFKIVTREGHVFALKPMNCPHHAQIFARRPHSYREMPQRYANTTMQYRDEQTGELSGLSRVRSISIDDAHVFCRQTQIQDEILKIWEIIDEFYGNFGFPLRVRLSLHDPKEAKKYLGSPTLWASAEKTLHEIAKEKVAHAEEGIGEAAFYGPKVDFMAKDSLGREWQVATIQLDMNQPERFDLSCINEKGEKERIVMIHAAIMGSLERFLAIIIEHFAGAFPFWLSPVQIQVLSVSDEAKPYAVKITQELEDRGYRVSFDDRNETIGKKIREGEMQKIPYLLIIGNRETESKTVAVRERGKGDLGGMDLEEFLKNIGK